MKTNVNQPFMINLLNLLKTFLLLKKDLQINKNTKKNYFFFIKLKIIKRPYLAIIVSEIFAVKLFRDSWLFCNVFKISW